MWLYALIAWTLLFFCLAVDKVLDNDFKKALGWIVVMMVVDAGILTVRFG